MEPNLHFKLLHTVIRLGKHNLRLTRLKISNNVKVSLANTLKLWLIALPNLK
jgi:hypothetical protein